MVDRSKFSSLIERISDELVLYNNLIAEVISNLTLNCSILSFDHNNFTGGLPNLSPKAFIVNLSYNSYSRSIPHSWKNLKNLEYINLWSKLSVEVPVHLFDLGQLQIINLGKNKFSGTIAIKMSQKLEELILRANQFERIIPTQLFNLTSLVHLNLAQNNFSGSMPECVYNLTNIVTLNKFHWSGLIIELFTKCQDYAYKVRAERRTIDLSANTLSGEMTLELFKLVQVQTLNLSHNNFIGTIRRRFES